MCWHCLHMWKVVYQEPHLAVELVPSLGQHQRILYTWYFSPRRRIVAVHPDALSSSPFPLILSVLGSSLVVQWLRLSCFTAMGPGSVPDWETKIPQARWPGMNE